MGTHGPEDPTRAALVFSAAGGAREAGLTATVALVGDGVLLINDAIAPSIIGLGRAPVDQLIRRAVSRDANVPKDWGPPVMILV
jgi:predicted peroxiredoxin